MSEIEYIDEKYFLRSEVARYREAALIAYGALVARHDGKPEQLFDVLNKYLFPTLSADAEESNNNG